MIENVLVLGFYNRKNLGDETYKATIPLLLDYDIKKECEIVFSFECMDDIDSIPENIDTIICGGGDIINDYFMEKAQKLLTEFKGRVYALSVGIPFAGASKYLHLFDHVFVRSQTDYEVAVNEIGEKNTSCIIDIATLLTQLEPKDKQETTQSATTRIGLCLAQPLFYNNHYKTQLINGIVDAIEKLFEWNNNIEIHFLAFNTFEKSNSECDFIINNTIYGLLVSKGIPCKLCHDVVEPILMLNYIKDNIDMTLCMRYHSIIFSMMLNKRFIPLYCSPKVDRILKDIDYTDTNYVYKLDVNKRFKPLAIDSNVLYTKLQNGCINRNVDLQFSNDYKTAFDLMFVNKKLANIMVKNKLESFDDVLIACKRNVSKYLQIDPYIFEEGLKQVQVYNTYGKDPINVARFISYLISGQINHPTIWGLAENLQKDDFCLYDAIKYIWEECKKNHDELDKVHTYYPQVSNLKREVLLNLDFVFQNDFAKYHRSGWSYVLGGIMNLDAPCILRKSDILLDTYVDRSFHWGYDILKTLEIVPYSQPWYGIIHHTFDTSHSDNNCVRLLENPGFIESLKTCQGLITLTHYLGDKLRHALSAIGQEHIKVYSLTHPMEFVENTFSMDKFNSNTEPCVINIGAWLRNPYAIYELPIYENNSLNIKKKALKGREMEQYFAPPHFLEVMQNVLLKRDWYRQKGCSKICRDSSVCEIAPVVPPFGVCDANSMCRPCYPSNNVNKFCQGVYNMLEKEIGSVSIIQNLSNEDYDELLSKNIVFLNLVDCSAVNTVIECIVRNTPIIINRLEPLEEFLGKTYPGFYDSLLEAAEFCTSKKKIEEIHYYILTLNKKKYKLEVFVDGLQDIISGKETDEDEEKEKEEIYIPAPTNVVVVPSLIKYQYLSKYLPPRFVRTYYGV